MDINLITVPAPERKAIVRLPLDFDLTVQTELGNLAIKLCREDSRTVLKVGLAGADAKEIVTATTEIDGQELYLFVGLLPGEIDADYWRDRDAALNAADAAARDRAEEDRRLAGVHPANRGYLLGEIEPPAWAIPYDQDEDRAADRAATERRYPEMAMYRAMKGAGWLTAGEETERIEADDRAHAEYLAGDCDVYGNPLFTDGATVEDADHAARLYSGQERPSVDDRQDALSYHAAHGAGLYSRQARTGIFSPASMARVAAKQRKDRIARLAGLTVEDLLIDPELKSRFMDACEQNPALTAQAYLDGLLFWDDQAAADQHDAGELWEIVKITPGQGREAHRVTESTFCTLRATVEDARAVANCRAAATGYKHKAVRAGAAARPGRLL